MIKGAEKITLHKALTMHGGLTIDSDAWKEFEKGLCSTKRPRVGSDTS